MHKSLLLHLSHRYVVQKGERVICKRKTAFKTHGNRFKPLSLCTCVCARKKASNKKIHVYILYICKKTLYKCAHLITIIHILICGCTKFVREFTFLMQVCECAVPYQSVTLDVTSEDRRIGISLRETYPLRVLTKSANAHWHVIIASSFR